MDLRDPQKYSDRHTSASHRVAVVALLDHRDDHILRIRHRTTPVARNRRLGDHAAARRQPAGRQYHLAAYLLGGMDTARTIGTVAGSRRVAQFRLLLYQHIYPHAAGTARLQQGHRQPPLPLGHNHIPARSDTGTVVRKRCLMALRGHYMVGNIPVRTLHDTSASAIRPVSDDRIVRRADHLHDDARPLARS